MQLTETPGKVFARVGADLSGPLPATIEGYRYLLTVVDHLSGYADALPIPDKRAITVWKAMEAIFARFGYPEELITDNGTEFTAEEIRQKYRERGIKHLRTSVLHPQTNGVVERFNRTIKETIRKMTNNVPRDWATHLNHALWAYRVSPQTTRGSSPYEILFGQAPIVAAEQIGDCRDENMARARRIAHSALDAAKVRRQQIGSQRERKIKPGSYVTLDDPEVPTFGHRRHHNFRVVSVHGKVLGVQEVRHPHQRPAAIKHVHVNRVREVPEDVDWSEIQPRVRRQRRPGVDARLVPHPDRQAQTDAELPNDDSAEEGSDNQSNHNDGDSVDNVNVDTDNNSQNSMQVDNAPVRHSYNLRKRRGPSISDSVEEKRSRLAWLATVQAFCGSSAVLPPSRQWK